MADTDPLHADRRLALSFGAHADAYDRHRPGFPDDMMDAIARLGTRVLDVGAGTGKAAVALMARGCDVVAVEPDPDMADIARAKGVTVELGTFEDWDPRDRQFDLVTFARSWHWVDPTVALGTLATILPTGGHVALLAHEASWKAFEAAGVREVIARVLPDDDTSRRRATDATVDLFAEAGFDVRMEEFPMSETVGVDDWLDTVFTYSRFLVLDDAAKADLRRELADAVGPGPITVHGSPRALIGRRL